MKYRITYSYKPQYTQSYSAMLEVEESGKWTYQDSKLGFSFEEVKAKLVKQMVPVPAPEIIEV